MSYDVPDFEGGGSQWDSPDFAGTSSSDPAVGRVDSAIDGKFTGISPWSPDDAAIWAEFNKNMGTSTKAPTGTAGSGTSISDSITGAFNTIAKAGIQNLAGAILGQASSQPSHQGPTGRPITDPQAGNSPTINILGVPIALHPAQLQNIQAGRPFSLTPGQRTLLGKSGANFSGRNLLLQSNGQLARSVNGQAVALSAQDGGTPADDKTTMLYFALAAGVLALLFFTSK